MPTDANTTVQLQKKKIKNDRLGKLSEKPLLLHDNVRPHSANFVQPLLAPFKKNVLPHQPYSPDLVHVTLVLLNH